jgi:hypothetical protein
LNVDGFPIIGWDDPMKTASAISVLFFAWMLQAAETTKIPNFRADVCRTPWTWVNSGKVTFQPGGRATVDNDAATKYTWKVKSSEQRLVEVEWTYAGNKRNAVFTFAEDMKSAKAVIDEKKQWESKPAPK